MSDTHQIFASVRVGRALFVGEGVRLILLEIRGENSCRLGFRTARPISIGKVCSGRARERSAQQVKTAEGFFASMVLTNEPDAGIILDFSIRVNLRYCRPKTGYLTLLVPSSLEVWNE